MTSWAGPEENVRSASLVARHRLNPLSGAAWALGWAVFALATAAMLWAALRGAPWAMLAGGAFWLLGGPMAARRSLLEPEPLDARGSSELRQAYDRLRRFKVLAFYVMGMTGTVVSAAGAVAMAISPRTGGLVWAGLGVSLGVAGGIVGAIGGVRRARVAELRRRLAAEPDARRGGPQA